MSAQLRMVMAAFGLALVLGAQARAATGAITAITAPEGYTRLEFAFDRAPKTEAKLSNGVLVVSFSEAVNIRSQELPRGVGSLIGVVRRDPDGTAIRMALNEPSRIVTTEAGERVFVDILPAGWKGLPPPLPSAVIAELTREAREARALKAGEIRLKAKPLTALTIEGASQPTFRRLIFKLGADAPVDYRRAGPVVAVRIGAPYAFDVAAARANLPTAFAGLDARLKGDSLTVTVPAPGAGAVRGFKDDGDFILDIDIDRDDAPKAEAHPAPEPLAIPAPGRNPGATSVRQPADPVQESSPAVGPAAAPPTPASPKTPAAPPAEVREDRAASVRRVGQTVRLAFPFARPTAAAVFQRGKTVWVLFDTTEPIDFARLAKDSGGAIQSAEPLAVDRGQAARLKLAEPLLLSAAAEGSDWIVSLGEDVLGRSGSVEFTPARDRAGRSAIQIDLAGLGAVRRITDPEIGDDVAVATLAPPARGVPAGRQFVEFAALPSAQGLAISLQAQDLRVDGSIDRVSIERDGGLTLSAALASAAPQAKDAGDLALGAASWIAERERPFAERESELMRGAALAAVADRPEARLALAKFYQVRGLAAESSAVLGAIVEDAGLSERDPRVAILRAAAEIELRRPASALAVLGASNLRMKPEAALWRAAAEAASGRAAQARSALQEGAPALPLLPAELKARFTALAVDLALQANDAAEAEAQFQELEVLPATEGPGAREVLRARVEEALGHNDKAAAAFAAVALGREPAAAAEAELRAVELGLKAGKLAPADAVARLEKLTTGWRGDGIEIAALAKLIELYGDAGRWRDAFSTMRIAVEVAPDADDTRALQDRMQNRFTELFLSGDLDKMPKLDALALFYDFKELAPGGKRGDELVRRLADKLVAVDLLDQAAELLDYQIDNRLTGAARAQVASRLALVELMNGKPGKAVETLRKTRQADLPSQLVKSRLRLEARALAETGRIDLALEMADGLEGDEARRVRADILWSARRWPEAGEAIEATLGPSWRDPAPLGQSQRADVMRAAIASALAGDALAVDRIRQKYAPKMADGPEAVGFEIVTAPIEVRGDAFREVARSIAATSSFQAFLDEYRKSADKTIGDGRPTASAGVPPKV